jgi:hypothetical protein
MTSGATICSYLEWLATRRCLITIVFCSAAEQVQLVGKMLPMEAPEMRKNLNPSPVKDGIEC